MKRTIRIILILSFIVLYLVLSNEGAIAQLSNSPWPMLQNNVRHTGLSPYNTSNVDGTVKWTYETGASIESSPTIATDGTIYIGSHDNKLYAFNPDGTLKWKFDAGEPVFVEGWDISKGIPSAPSIDQDGTIYFISPPIYLFALNPDGSEKWRYDTEGSCLANPLALANDGTIYVTGSNYEPGQPTTGNALLAFNPDGTITHGGNGFGASAAISADGTVYVGSQDKKVYAFGGSRQTVNQNNNVNNANQKNNSTILIISLALLILIIWLIYAYLKHKWPFKAKE